MKYRLLQGHDQYIPSLTTHLFSQYSTPSSLSSSNIHLLSIPWLYQVLSYLRDLSQAVCSAWNASLKIFPFHPTAFSVNNMSIVRPSLITQPEICFPLSLHPIDSFFFLSTFKNDFSLSIISLSILDCESVKTRIRCTCPIPSTLYILSKCLLTE